MPVIAQFGVRQIDGLAKYRQLRNTDGSLHFVIGMAVSTAAIPEDWYFQELAASGINTVFYMRKVDRSPSGTSDLRKFLEGAEGSGLKVIVGLAAEGQKPQDWSLRWDNFRSLVQDFRKESNIIGWYPVDEPSAVSWSDQELETIYAELKRYECKRIVFSNWAYDGVPHLVKTESRGILKSSDVVSFSDYPFAINGRGLCAFSRSLAIISSATNAISVPSHAWIQLYSGFDAWREPTARELRYMIYLSLISGSMFSYWDSKSEFQVNVGITRQVKS